MAKANINTDKVNAVCGVNRGKYYTFIKLEDPHQMNAALKAKCVIKTRR